VGNRPAPRCAEVPLRPPAAAASVPAAGADAPRAGGGAEACARKETMPARKETRGSACAGCVACGTGHARARQPRAPVPTVPRYARRRRLGGATYVRKRRRKSLRSASVRRKSRVGSAVLSRVKPPPSRLKVAAPRRSAAQTCARRKSQAPGHEGADPTLARRRATRSAQKKPPTRNEIKWCR